MDEPTMDNVLRRLDRVERENRWLKCMGALALIGAAALVIMGQAKPSSVAKLVEAEKFVVRDAGGGVGAVLGVTTDGNLGLEIRDKGGKAGVTLGMGASGNPALRLDGKDGKAGAALGVRSDNSAGLELYDKDGKIVWATP